MFNNMKKTIEESQKRWEEIEHRISILKENLEHSGNATPISITTAKLLLLLVEHIKPMNPSKEQLSEATKGLADLLDSLK